MPPFFPLSSHVFVFEWLIHQEVSRSDRKQVTFHLQSRSCLAGPAGGATTPQRSFHSLFHLKLCSYRPLPSADLKPPHFIFKQVICSRRHV